MISVVLEGDARAGAKLNVGLARGKYEVRDFSARYVEDYTFVCFKCY